MKTVLQQTLPNDLQTIVEILQYIYPGKRLKDISICNIHTWVTIHGRIVTTQDIHGPASSSKEFDYSINNHKTELWGPITANDYQRSREVIVHSSTAYPGSIELTVEQKEWIIQLLRTRGYKLPSIKEFQHIYNED